MNPARMVNATSFRLSSLYLGLFLCSFLAIGTTVYFLTTHSLEQQLKTNLDSEITRLKTEYDSGGLPELVTEINEMIASKSNRAQEYGVLNQDARLIAGNLSQFKLVEGWQTLRPGLPTKNQEQHTTLMVRVIPLSHQLWLGVSHESNTIEAAGDAIINAFLWGIVLVMILGAAGGLYISRAFLKKIDGITQSTQAIIAGDLTHRLAVSENRDELDKLASLLNQMLDKICALIENFRQVSNDIAHDLRTPVGRLKFRLEDTLQANLSKAQYAKQIGAAIAEIDSILETFSALLRISQIESQSRRSGFKSVNLSEVVTTVCEALIPVGEEQRKVISTEISPNLNLPGDKELLTQLIFNLLENAIVHTADNTQITVQLNFINKSLELMVADRGAGIARDQRQKVFQRFYRLEQSRTTSGNGLGLSIVAAIVELHDGTITLSDNQPGLKVVVNFPT